MANHQHLFHYIKNKSKAGFSKEEIKSVLIEVGWKDDLLEEVFILVEEKEKERGRGFRKIGFIIFIFLILSILFSSFLIFNKNKIVKKIDIKEESKIEKHENINPNLSQQEYVENLYKGKTYSATTSTSSTIQN